MIRKSLLIIFAWVLLAYGAVFGEGVIEVALAVILFHLASKEEN